MGVSSLQRIICLFLIVLSSVTYASDDLLQHVLKDAAILRLLEVGGYAKVPQGFYQNLPQDWKFE